MVASGFSVPVKPGELFENGKGSPLRWLESCIQRGFDVNSTDSSGKLTFLHWFIENYRRTRDILPAVVELLCQHGANVNHVRPKFGDNVLMNLLLGIRSTNHNADAIARTVVKLVEFGADVNHVDAYGLNVLCYLAVGSCEEVLEKFLPFVEALLKNGLDASQQEATFLHLFVNLLPGPWPLTVHDEQYWTGFNIQLSAGRATYPFIKLFLDYGLDVNCCNEQVPNLLLYLASDFFQRSNGKNKLELARLLIDAGIKLDERDECGNTALILLCIRQYGGLDRGFIDLATLFLDSGVDVNARNMDEQSALCLLLETCRYGIALQKGVALLISRGADVSHSDGIIANMKYQSLVRRAYAEAFVSYGYRGELPENVRDLVMNRAQPWPIQGHVCKFIWRQQSGIGRAPQLSKRKHLSTYKQTNNAAQPKDANTPTLMELRRSPRIQNAAQLEKNPAKRRRRT